MSQQNNPPGQNKEYKILVNMKEKTVTDKKVTFNQIVKFAFPNGPANQNIEYTVLYKKADQSPHEHEMDKDDTVTVKDGTTFSVTETDKS